ncbi:MAG: hypothetical protein WCG83_01570 [Candidatus Peregrinibacteria bacterium]
MSEAVRCSPRNLQEILHELRTIDGLKPETQKLHILSLVAAEHCRFEYLIGANEFCLRLRHLQHWLGEFGERKRIEFTDPELAREKFLDEFGGRAELTSSVRRINEWLRMILWDRGEVTESELENLIFTGKFEDSPKE